MTATDMPALGPEDVDHGYALGLKHWADITWLLALRTFRLRYLRSKLGIGWALILPLVQAAILAFIFTRIFRIGNGEHYPLYVLSGVMTWQAFSSSANMATTAAVDNSGLLTKVDMPVVVFPLSQIVSVLLVFLMQLAVLVGMAVLAGTAGFSLLLLPVVLVLVAYAAVGLALIGCAFHVAVRDVKFIFEAGLLLAFYGSPILYSPEAVPAWLRPWLELNPMYGVLTSARSALLGTPIHTRALMTSVAVSSVLLIVGAAVFRRRSRDFADLV